MRFQEYLDKEHTLYKLSDRNTYQTVFHYSNTDDSSYERVVLKAIGSDCKVLRLPSLFSGGQHYISLVGVDLDEINENVREIVLENRSEFIGKDNTLPSNFIKDPTKLPKLKELRAITRDKNGKCLTNVWIKGWDNRVVPYAIRYKGMLYITLSKEKDSVATLGGCDYTSVYRVDGDLAFPEKILDGSKEYTLKHIEYYSFIETKIKSLTIPSSVRSIEEGAFRLCYHLEKVNFSEGLEAIGDYAFCGCERLEELKLPDTLISMGYDAFNGCPLKHVRLGASLKRVSDLKCEIVTIPADFNLLTLSDVLRSIVTAEFRVDANCDTLRVEDGVLYDKEMKKLLAYPTLKDQDTFTVPSSVTSIADNAFKIYLTILKEVRIPKSVRKIPTCLKSQEVIKVTRID